MNAQNLPKFSINQEFSQFSEPSFSSNPSLFSEKKSSSQFKALFLKSVTLQFKQIGTNICQVLTPLICLSIVLIIKQVTTDLFQGKTYNMPIPLPFNLPTINSYFSYSGLPFKLQTCQQWYFYDIDENLSQETIDFIGVNPGEYNKKNGLLGRVMNSYICYYKPNKTSVVNRKIVPYFQRPSNGSTINEELFNKMLFLNSQPLKRHKDVPNLDVLPDGAVKFLIANDEKLSYILQINDLRVQEYHRDNGITKVFMSDNNGDYHNPILIVSDGQLSFLDLINKAYLNYFAPNYWIMSGVQYMPVKDQDKSWLMKIINLAGASLFPLSLSLLLPVFMYAIVLEKEEKLLEMMKMNGLKMRNYWFVTYIFNFSMYFIMIVIFFVFGYALLELSFFTETHPGILLLTTIGWGLSQVSLALFFQVFISKARTSTIIGYLLSVWTIIISVSLNIGVYPDPYQLPFGLRLYPPFAFCRIIYLISNACSNDLCYKSFSILPQELNHCFLTLYLGSMIFLLLAIYLHEIIPQEYGVRKHPLFFFSCLCKKRYVQNNNDNLTNPLQADDPEVQIEDLDSKNERDFVALINSFSEYPLVCKNLQKTYKSQGGRPANKAIKNFSLAIRPGEIFGLLGPNGAGKTTLISMITGLYPPTNGNAWVSGFSIKEEINQVHLLMGVCPQFDLLWPDLTIREHLTFYARLKGINRADERKKVDSAMREVVLEKFEKFKAKELSGGMKRRLSVAISLVGEPKIVFLDEPTTGLDPENRRQLWDILVGARGKRAMILTTHSMEEADVLCSRIGIITEGVLRCVGPQVRLKSLYGGGYHLFVNCHKENYIKMMEDFENQNENYQINNKKDNQTKDVKFYHDRIIDFLKYLLPKSILVSSFNGNFVFQIPSKETKIWRLFEELEKTKKELMISDWGISQSSLEDVFMRVVN